MTEQTSKHSTAHCKKLRLVYGLCQKKPSTLEEILGSKKSYCRWSDFAKNHFGELAKRSENSGRGQARHILRALETRKKGEHIWREMDTAILKTGQGLGNWFPDFGFTIFGPVIFLYLFKIHSVSSVTFVSREAVSEQIIGPTPPTQYAAAAFSQNLRLEIGSMSSPHSRRGRNILFQLPDFSPHSLSAVSLDHFLSSVHWSSPSAQ